MYTLSLADGSLTTTNTEPAPAPTPWTEAVLQHILVLNPKLLGVEDQLPLELDGGSTAVGTDQMFIDEVGRVTFIELKNERAGLEALAQLLSYANHWRGQPIGELDCGLRNVARRRTEDVFTESLNALAAWSGVRVDRSTSRPLPYTRWPVVPAMSVLAKAHWGAESVLIPEAPTRMVLVAPEFSKKSLRLASELASRYVAIELIRANLHRDDAGGVFLSWETVVAPAANLEATWRAASHLWRKLPILRERFRLNGWADCLSTNTFSFSHAKVPSLRILLDADRETIDLSTFVPDGWYTGTTRRQRLRDAFLTQLPTGHDGGRFLTWSFPANNPSVAAETLAQIVEAIEVLSLEAPQ